MKGLQANYCLVRFYGHRLDRIKYLSGQPKSFYLTIAPTTPHLPAVPLERHSQLFLDKKAPRPANFNPVDEIQANAVSWVADVPLMTASQINATDELFRNRIQGLQGVDEIIEDVVALLGDLGILDNTYIVYSSDNGYHLGNHRLPHGKTLPFVEDTNLPFIVRGPGVPANKTSEFPSAHLDLAPTFLEIAGVPKENWPTFLDGRSLLTSWKNPNAAQVGLGSCFLTFRTKSLFICKLPRNISFTRSSTD